jgi:hypothetical protein
LEKRNNSTGVTGRFREHYRTREDIERDVIYQTAIIKEEIIILIIIIVLYYIKHTLVPEVYFYYFPCEGERKNKPLEPGYIKHRIPQFSCYF